MTSAAPWMLLGHAAGSRPAPIPHAAIAPPFDPGDSGGIVHTVLPPEQIIPPHFTDPTFMRADFNGVTLDMTRWTAQTLPFLNEANSTPLSMLMTPMLIMYPRYWQDACLTEHAERGYDDFIISPEPWAADANGFAYNIGTILDWCRYVQSWGFRLVIWRGDPHSGMDAMFHALFDTGLVSFYIDGEEVDRQMSAPDYEASLQQMDAYVGGRVPLGVHFTADGGRQMGYPIGFPRDTFLNDWSPYNGRVHLCQQLDVTAPAGLQGASMWEGRLIVNCGLTDAGRGPGAPDSRVIAFETMATAQLYGRCTEGYGNLRDWQLLCGTRTDPRARPVSGFGNGCRYPDGTPI